MSETAKQELAFYLQNPIITDFSAGNSVRVLEQCAPGGIFRKDPATSGTALDNIQFVGSTNEGDILDPMVYMRLPIKFQVVLAAGGNDLSEADFKSKFCLSHYALYQEYIRTMEVKINGKPLTIKPTDVIKIIGNCIEGQEYLDWEYSRPDPSWTYSATNDTNVDSTDFPFGLRKSVDSQRFVKRTFGTRVVRTAARNYDVFVDGIVSLPLSLFVARGAKRGIAHVSSFTVTLTCDASKAATCLNMTNEATYTVESVVMSFTNTPELITNWRTPPDSAKKLLYTPSGEAIPHFYNYKTYQSHYEVKAIGGANDEFTITCSDWPSIPSKVYVAVERVRGAGAPGNPNVMMKSPTAFAEIEQLSLTAYGRNDHFDGFGQYELFQMSSRSGYNFDFDMWKKNGSIICIDVGAGDLVLKPNDYVGKNTTTKPQIRVKVKNQSHNVADFASTNQYRIYVVSVHEEVLEIGRGTCERRAIGNITEEEMRQMQDRQLIVAKQNTIVLGGNIFDTLKNIGKKIWDSRGTIANIIGDGVKLVKAMKGGAMKTAVMAGDLPSASLGGATKKRATKKGGNVDNPDFSRFG